MNNEFYDRLKNNVENFTETYCKMVPLDQIDYDVYNSQIRASGHVVSMVPRYAESIRTHGIDRDWETFCSKSQ